MPKLEVDELYVFKRLLSENMQTNAVDRLLYPIR